MRPSQPRPLLLYRGTNVGDIRCLNAAKNNLTTDKTNPSKVSRVTYPRTTTPDKSLDIIIIIPIKLMNTGKELDMST